MSAKIDATASKELVKELSYLEPISKPIMIGKDIYDIDELTDDKYEQLMGVIAEGFSAFYLLKEDKASMEESSVFISKMVEIISRRIVPILMAATGLAEEDIKGKITARQIVYAAKVIWEVNGRGVLEEITKMKDDVKASYTLFMDSLQEDIAEGAKEIVEAETKAPVGSGDEKAA
jgi:hypothetical protein